MKRLMMVLSLVFCVMCVVMGPVVLAEAVSVTPADPSLGATLYTYAQLLTVSGATAATLLIVQYFKVPLDKVWKIPTRVFVFLVALGVMLIAHAFEDGLQLAMVPLIALNAIVVGFAAMGAYEATFSPK